MLSLNAATGDERTRVSVIPGERRRGQPPQDRMGDSTALGLHAKRIETPAKCHGGGGLMVCLNRLPHCGVNINLGWRERRLEGRSPIPEVESLPLRTKPRMGWREWMKEVACMKK